MRQKIIILFAVLIAIGIYVMPRYLSFSYYKSPLFIKASQQLSDDYNSYFFNYLERPKKISDFISFCNNNYHGQNIIDKSAVGLNHLFKDGLYIDSTLIKNHSTIISLGYNRERNKHNTILNPDSMNFFDYLFKSNDIFISINRDYSPCEIDPRLIFFIKDSLLISSDTIRDSYIEKIFDFNKNKFHRKLLFADRGNDYLYFRGDIDNGNLTFNIICDPFEKREFDYSILYLSLDSLFSNAIFMESVDFFYFPLNIDTNYFDKNAD